MKVHFVHNLHNYIFRILEEREHKKYFLLHYSLKMLNQNMQRILKGKTGLIFLCLFVSIN